MKFSLPLAGALVVVGGLHLVQAQQPLRLFEWERGIGFESPVEKQMRVYVWFYEWHMFEARRPGQHTGGSYDWPKRVSSAGDRATTGPEDLRLRAEAAPDGAVLTLQVTNRSGHDWPELAAVIPCFNPGPEETRNPQFANTNTYFYGPQGLKRQLKREIHFNQALRASLDGISPEGEFAFSHKWPTSEANAAGGIIIRESTDGKWVTGIAWEDFLSVQGHNPWECMHLSVRVGPLKRGQQKTIRGKVYLFQGTKEDCLNRYLADFK